MSENNPDSNLWANAIKSIGKLEGEFKYIRDTLDDIKLVLKDCPQHQMRTANLEKDLKDHFQEHTSDLKKAVDLRASRVSIIIGAITLLGNLIVVSWDKILTWISKVLKGT